MKKIITSILLLPATLGYAQMVGINTDTPKATLHITDMPSDNYTITDGVIDAPRDKVGFKIPTHAKLPTVPYQTEAQKELSKAKNGMLVFLDNTDNQGFYYWDNNDLSWQNLIDKRNVNLDISKTIVSAKALTGTSFSSTTPQQHLVFSDIQTFDDDFKIHTDTTTNTNSIVIGKPASYYFSLVGSLVKTSDSATGYTLNVKVNGETKFSTAISVPANTNSEKRGANFVLTKYTSFEKDDKISVSITSSTSSSSGTSTTEYSAPFTITLIKLN